MTSPATALSASHAFGATDTPLIEATIGDFFADMARRQGEREALVSRHQGLRYTYAGLHRAVRQLASALLQSGLEKGDRVGIWSHNNAEWVLMQLATAQVGIILVNINPAYRTAEVEYALNKVGCKALVTMAQFKSSDYLGMLRELAPELGRCMPGMLAAKRLPSLRTVVWIDVAGQGANQPGMLRFSDWLAKGQADDPQVDAVAATLSNTDPINIQFTSGTTGFPKGATLTHRNILNNGFFIGECMKLTAADRLCIPVPLYHCFGMVLGNLACFTHGSTVVYPNDGFDPLTVLETVQAGALLVLHRLQYGKRLKTVVRIDDGSAVRQTSQIAQHHAKAVVQRHRNAQPVGRRQSHRFADEKAVVQDVAVRQRRALGKAGGAAGELEVDRVGRLERGGDGGQARIVSVAAGKQIREAHQARLDFFGLALPGLVNPDDAVKVRQRDGFKLAGLRVCPLGCQFAQHAEVVTGLEAGHGDQRFAVDLVQRVLDFCRAVRRVDVDQNQADFGRGQLHQHPFGIVVRPDADALARLQAQAEQRAGEAVGLNLQFAVAVAAALMNADQRFVVGLAGRDGIEKRTDGLLD